METDESRKLVLACYRALESGDPPDLERLLSIPIEFGVQNA